MTTPHDRRRYLDRLRAIAERLDGNAIQVENGDNTAQGGRLASQLKAEAYAVRWALREIEPVDELQPRQQFFDQLAGE